MKQVSVILILNAFVPDDAKLEEIREKVDDQLGTTCHDFRINEIETCYEDGDLKEPWFEINDSYVTESFTLVIYID